MQVTKKEEMLIKEACEGGKRRIEKEYNLRKKDYEQNKNKTYELPVWVKIEGCNVLRYKDSSYIAIPDTRRKNSKNFTIINLDDLDAENAVCFLNKEEVRNWLIRKYETEKN